MKATTKSLLLGAALAALASIAAPGVAAEPRSSPARELAALRLIPFERMDADKSGELGDTELPIPLSPSYPRADTNASGPASPSTPRDFSRFLMMMAQRGRVAGKQVYPAAAVGLIERDYARGLPHRWQGALRGAAEDLAAAR